MDGIFDWKWIANQGPIFFLLCVIIYMYHNLVREVMLTLKQNTEAMTQLVDIVKAMRHHDG